MTDWEEAFKATGWSPPAAAVPVGSPGDDWEQAFASVGWKPTVSGSVGGGATLPARPDGGPQAGGSEVEAYIRQAAAQRGIDPDIAVRVAQSEGGTTEPAKRGTFATGSSWWPFQLHYGGKGYEQFGTVAGMGNTFTAKTGLQPGDPAAWRAATDYALDAAKQQGWGAWYGARKQGITGYQGIGGPQSGQRAGTPVPSTPSRAAPTSGGGSVAGGDWESAFRSAGWDPSARSPASSPAASPPWTPPGAGGGGPPGGAVFPVAGYTGKVELHHGAQAGVGGSDLFAPEGTPVVAMVPGTVQWASTNDSLGGNNVGIVGDDGLTYYYAHFKNAPRVKAGDRVGSGQQIGDVGRSGNAASTPPHLHLGIGRGIQTGAGAQGGLGREFDAVGYLRRTLTGAAPAHPDAPAAGSMTSSAAGTGAPGSGDWEQAFRGAGFRF